MSTLFQDGELAAAPEKIVQDAFDAWNATAKPLGWRTALVLTDARRKSLKRAVRDYGGLIGFKAALARASKSPFLLGHVGRTGAHRNWKPDLDFICRPQSVIRLLEGFYDGEIEQPKKLFIPTAYQPPHLKAAVPFVPESAEVRLEALAASYHKVGKYKDEARVLEQLAKLTGKPFVMTPAPDVAHLNIPAKEPEPPRRPAPTITDVEPAWTDDIPEGADYGSE